MHGKAKPLKITTSTWKPHDLDETPNINPIIDTIQSPVCTFIPHLVQRTIPSSFRVGKDCTNCFSASCLRVYPWNHTYDTCYHHSQAHLSWVEWVYWTYSPFAKLHAKLYLFVLDVCCLCAQINKIQFSPEKNNFVGGSKGECVNVFLCVCVC